MKIFRVIVHHEFCVLAEDTLKALEAAKSIIANNLEPISEVVALEPRRETDLPKKWLDQVPFLAEEIPENIIKDTDTCAVLFDRLYVQPKPKTKAAVK